MNETFCLISARRARVLISDYAYKSQISAAQLGDYPFTVSAGKERAYASTVTVSNLPKKHPQ